MQSTEKKRRLKVYQMSANEYAVFLLSMKLQSEGQLREKLKRKKYSQADIDKAIAYLEDLHYLDDSRFAEVFFENLKKYKNFGYYGIKKKLIERKLPQKLIEKTLSQFTNSDELLIAKRLLNKYPSRTMEQKAKMLQSKGFRTVVIYKATKKELENSSDLADLAE